MNELLACTDPSHRATVTVTRRAALSRTKLRADFAGSAPETSLSALRCSIRLEIASSREEPWKEGIKCPVSTNHHISM